MSNYIALYLPISSELTDGCLIINQYNEVFEYDEVSYVDQSTEFIRPCALHLVNMVYNQPVILGLISPKVKWIKSGDTVLPKNCKETTLIDEISKEITTVWRIVCPNCGSLH